MAHVWYEPATRAVTPVGADSATGSSLSVVVPLPSCPNALSPQHETDPPFRMMHVWNSPPVIASTSSQRAAAQDHPHESAHDAHAASVPSSCSQPLAYSRSQSSAPATHAVTMQRPLAHSRAVTPGALGHAAVAAGPSVAPSQSLSTPSQTSAAPGLQFGPASGDT